MLTTRSQLLKGILDACVMEVIREEAIYGYELSQKLQQVGLHDISDGTIYPVLLRLQKNGFIKGEMKPSPTRPNRKYYYLTDRGKEELEKLALEWMLVSEPVSKLLKRG